MASSPRPWPWPRRGYGVPGLWNSGVTHLWNREAAEVWGFDFWNIDVLGIGDVGSGEGMTFGYAGIVIIQRLWLKSHRNILVVGVGNVGIWFWV